MSSTELLDLLDLTRLDDLVTRPSKDSLFTESECDEVDERDLPLRVPPMVSPQTWVLTNSSTSDHCELLLKSELAEEPLTCEFSTLTGSTRIQPTSTLKSFWLILSTKLFDEMLDTTGSLTLSTNTEKLEDLLLLERRAEVSTKDTCSTIPRVVDDISGRSTTPCLCGDTDRYEATKSQFYIWYAKSFSSIMYNLICMA
jgi:hypothetical protein